MRRHHHDRAAAEGIIVALLVLVLCVIADIHGIYLDFVFLLRPAQNALAQRREHFGKERQYIDFHFLIPNFGHFHYPATRICGTVPL